MDEQDKILLSQRSNNYLSTNKLKELYPNVDRIEIAVRKVLIHLTELNNTKN
jgi:hypothetical protein